jgi:hypothetical protein
MGALVAGVVIIGLAGEGRGIPPARAAGLVVGLGELAMLGVAAAWAVERSARWERVAWRAAWPGVLMAAALAAVSDAGRAGREIALWSGPWGWAVQPGAGVPDGEWAAALVLLTVATAAAATAAVRDSGGAPAERHLRRAEARASAIASLGSYDARTARRALERVGARDAGRPAPGLGRVRAARLAIPWRDAVAAMRTPGRILEGAALAAGGTVLGLLNGERPVAVIGAALVVYLGASRLLWPLRAELDTPPRTRVLLLPRLGRVVFAHTLLPGIVVTLAAALGAAGCATAGALPSQGAAAALLAVAAAPLLTACAGMSARRGGRVPHSVLATALAADPSGGASALVGWLTFWPTVAAVVGAVPTILVTTVGSGAVTVAVVWTVVAAAILAALLDRDPVER